MKIIFEESVDYEPLCLRFVLAKPLPQKQASAISSFIIEWMGQQEVIHPEDWKFCEYSAHLLNPAEITVYCELMPSDAISALSNAVSERFPFVTELRLGKKEIGGFTLKNIDWITIPPGDVVIDAEAHEVDAFTINFTAISVGQFQEFLESSGYVPVPDRLERKKGFTVSNFKLNYGNSPKIPLFGVTFDDAVAFAKWAGLRLPTDPELRRFYEFAFVQMEKDFDWDGETWTSTPAGNDMYYVRSGPYREIPKGHSDPDRMALHRHDYKNLEAPSIRVVKKEKVEEE